MKPQRFAAFVLSLCLAVPAAADVTIRSKMKSGGFRGIGGFEGTMTRSVKGDKAREVSDVKYSNALMRLAAPPKGGVRITRVDLNKIWQVVPAKKSYSEQSIAGHAKAAEGRGSSRTGDTSGGDEEPGAEEKPTHRVKKSEFTVDKTGRKKTINGFPTEENAVRFTIEVEEIASKEVTTFKFDTDVWTTPLNATLRKAMDEEAKFYQAYMKKLGVKMSPKDREMFNPASVAMMLGVGQKGAADTLAQVKKKMETISGYPILTDARWVVLEDPRAAAREKAAAMKDDEDDAGLDLSGGVAGAAGSLFGGFAKKKMKERQAKKEEERAGQPMFSTYYEVLGVDAASIPADQFEVPAGYKKTGG